MDTETHKRATIISDIMFYFQKDKSSARGSKLLTALSVSMKHMTWPDSKNFFSICPLSLVSVKVALMMNLGHNINLIKSTHYEGRSYTE